MTTISLGLDTFGDVTVGDDGAPTPMDQVLLQILTHVSSLKGREVVPPIVIGGVISPFPLRIDVRVGDQMVS